MPSSSSLSAAADDGGSGEGEDRDHLRYVIVSVTNDRGRRKRVGGERSIGAVPRGALLFVEVPYGAEAAARALYGAPFRREIGIPDGAFPSSWGGGIVVVSSQMTS